MTNIRINNEMRALKNRKRIKRNTEFIENYTRNTINGSNNVLALELLHQFPITLSASKKKIRDLFEKIRNKFENFEYLLVTNLQDRLPKHKMLITLDGSSAKLEQAIRRIWNKFTLEAVVKEDAERYAQSLSDFYLDAAESIPFTNENSKEIKSKLFQRSRISDYL